MNYLYIILCIVYSVLGSLLIDVAHDLIFTRKTEIRKFHNTITYKQFYKFSIVNLFNVVSFNNFNAKLDFHIAFTDVCK